jgi:hypothetical protein
MSSNGKDNSLLTLALAVAITAGVTHFWTRRLEEQKVTFLSLYYLSLMKGWRCSSAISLFATGTHRKERNL